MTYIIVRHDLFRTPSGAWSPKLSEASTFHTRIEADLAAATEGAGASVTTYASQRIRKRWNEPSSFRKEDHA